MRNVVGVIAALLVVACANDEVLSVPGCACEDTERGRVCSLAACESEAAACELPNGSFCVSQGALAMCADEHDTPQCTTSRGEPIEGTFVCVSIDFFRTLEPCE